MTAMKIDLPYLYDEPDHRGNPRLYVRKGGRRIRIREKPGTVAFNEAYNEAIGRLPTPTRPEAARITPARRGTFGWLAAQYFDSAEFRGFNDRSRATRRGVIEGCLIEPRSPDAPKDLMRDCPCTALSAAHIRMLRDRKAGTPGAANNRKKYLSSMFSWAVEAGHMAANPCRDVRRVRYASEGFHTWTIEEVAQFAKVHPRGTKAHLALALLLFTGARPSDTAKLGRQHVRGNEIGFVPGKVRHLRRDVTYKPMLPILQEIIAATPCGAMTFIETEYGRPFSDKGFGNKMRQWCDAAGLPHCAAHGLRKAGATIAAENGATVHELMAIYDWRTTRQAEVYTRSADRKRLAASGMPLLALGMK